MKKMLLTSAGFLNPKIADKFLELVNKPVSEIKILFIPIASRTKEELFYVDESRQELLDLGILKENIIDFNFEREISEEELKSFNSVYVCGGNTFYLLHKIRKSNFDKKIFNLINKGVVYLGVSAGSMILGPDIGFTALPDENDINLRDTTGLNLIDVAISPHYCKEEEKDVKDWQNKTDYKILPLTDNQALLIIDGKEEIIE